MGGGRQGWEKQLLREVEEKRLYKKKLLGNLCVELGMLHLISFF